MMDVSCFIYPVDIPDPFVCITAPSQPSLGKLPFPTQGGYKAPQTTAHRHMA